MVCYIVQSPQQGFFIARIVHGGRVRGTCGAIRVDMSVLILIIAYLRWRFHDLHGAEGFALLKPSLSRSLVRCLARNRLHHHENATSTICARHMYAASKGTKKTTAIFYHHRRR